MSFSDELMIGVSINSLSGITGEAYGIPEMLRAAQDAEAMGFDGVWVHDAPLGRRTVASFDSVEILAAIAARTSRLKLCTGILQPQLRNPVYLALQWATLFTLSEGRAILGVGTGAGKSTLVQREYEAAAALRHDTTLDAQALHANRGKLFRENVEIMRRLWSEDKFSYEGEFYRFNEVTLGLARPETMPPVLMGAGVYFPQQFGGPIHHGWTEEKAGKFVLGPYKRVIDLSDGWLAVHANPSEIDEAWAKIAAYGQEVHPKKEYAKAFNCFVNVDDDPVKARSAAKAYLNDWHTMIGDDVVDRWAVAGPPEVVAGRLREFMDRGVKIFQLVVASPDHFGQMRRIGEQVLPLLR